MSYYGARWYDASLARFISADTIVPQPGNPQALNRYAYTLNSPLRYTDPSGHDPQYYGDPDPNDAPCGTDWCWQNRYFRAHGYDWDPSANYWTMQAAPYFYDEAILREMAGAAGITFAGAWSFDAQMQDIAAGIALFGRRLANGLGALQRLLGGGASLIHGSCLGASCAWPRGTQMVKLTNGANRYTIVHELAHIISYESRIQTGMGSNYGGYAIPVYGMLSDAWTFTSLTDYGDPQKRIEPRPYPASWDAWADAVGAWVFYGLNVNSGVWETAYPLNPPNRVDSVELHRQMNRMTPLINGWW